MRFRTVADNWHFSKWGLLGLVLVADYPVRALDGASFTESIRTEATTRVATATHRRFVTREARFGVVLRGDTLVVSTDGATLSETADGRDRVLDTDGFVGGRFHLLLSPTGRATLLERPFVPDDIIEVSDVGRAMDDFFPPLPPAIAVNATRIDSAGREWRRAPDSSGVQRFRWSHQRESEGIARVGDSVPAEIAETTHEASALAWSPVRGPLHWTRRIESDVTTRLRGQTIRASVIQRIDVQRTR